MVVTFLVWFYLFFIFLVYGDQVLRWLEKISLDEGQSVKIHISIRIIFGMIFLSVLGIWFSLFLPLSRLVNLLFLLGALFLLIRNRSSYMASVSRFFATERSRQDWFVIGVYGCVFVFVLIAATGKSQNPDTLLYHIQTVRWIETYPVVPGLANFHFRLGFNSSWLLVNALFSFVFLFGQSLHVMLGFFVLMASWYFLDGFHKAVAEKSIVGLFRLILILLMLYVVKSELSSPGTDIPAILFLWMSIELFWRSLDANELSGKVYQTIAVAFSLFAITIKLSVLPVLLVPVLILVRNFSSKRAWLVLVVMSSFVLLPWMARSVILSGYLVFPFPGIDVLSFDWKMPISRVVEIRDEIVAFARIPGEPIDDVLKLPFEDWFLPWFDRLTLIRQGLVLAALFSPVIFGLRYFLKPKMRHDLILLYFVIYSGLLYWFLSAPAFRFGFGFIALVIVFIVFMFLEIKFSDLARPLGFAILIAAFLYSFYLLGISLQDRNISSRVIFPVGYESPKTTECFIGDKKLECANSYGWCGYESFPCATKIRFDVIMRGYNWSDGFRTSP